MATESQVVELDVVMHCEGCAAGVRRAVKKIPGIVNSNVDFEAQKVTVEGVVDRQDVLRRIRKTGKRAKLIPGPNDAADPPAEEKKEEIKEEKKGTKKVHPFMTYYPYKLLAQYCCRCLPKKSAPTPVPVPPPA